MSFAKAMVNIQPADQNTPAMLPEWTIVRLGFVSVDMLFSPFHSFGDPLGEQHFNYGENRDEVAINPRIFGSDPLSFSILAVFCLLHAGIVPGESVFDFRPSVCITGR
jgi:hypothetical protein